MDRKELLELKCFDDIDRHTARYLTSGKDDSPLITLIIMLLSRMVYSGDVCMDINAVGGRALSEFFSEGDDDYETVSDITLPSSGEIISALKGCSFAGEGDDFMPLILDESGRLYFYKYRKLETSLARYIKSGTGPGFSHEETEHLKEDFAALFPGCMDTPDMQALSAYLSLRNRFTVISGGPGTGKTSTVVKIIILLVSAYRKQGRDISIALCAPTGKASARLRESVSSSMSSIKVSDDIASLVPGDTYTIHRLLKTRKRGGFVHDELNPLPYDVVVVDESSMVDLALMSRLAGALKPDSHFILLGDKDQLASVEGGAVFGDICGRGVNSLFSPGMSEEARSFFGISDRTVLPSGPAQGPVSDSLAILRKSYRFGTESGIGLLAESIKNGDSDRCIELLCSGEYPDISLLDGNRQESAERIVRDRVFSFLSNAGPVKEAEMTAGFISYFSVLTATRSGPGGMKNMNSLVESVLAAERIIDPSAGFYTGRPVMVKINSYSLNLFNGDVGVVDRDGNGLHVLFEGEEGAAKKIPLLRLPEHETAYACTVHKSQGSEFDHVMIVLPDRWSGLLTRELLYTAVTRARQSVVVAAGESLVRQIVNTPVSRSTGLREMLWG